MDHVARERSIMRHGGVQNDARTKPPSTRIAVLSACIVVDMLPQLPLRLHMTDDTVWISLLSKLSKASLPDPQLSGLYPAQKAAVEAIIREVQKIAVENARSPRQPESNPLDAAESGLSRARQMSPDGGEGERGT
jgi:hypothetical protein